MKNIKFLIYSALLVLISSLCEGQSWIWAREAYGPFKNDGGNGISVATNKYGDAYITGTYAGRIIFGVDTLQTLTLGTFLVKYNSSGAVIWAKQPKDSNGSCYGLAVTTDRAGNLYLTGDFHGSVKFGPYVLTAGNVMSAFFLAKYDSNGNIIWAKQSFGANAYSIGGGSSIAPDNKGNLYVTGVFRDTVTIGTTRLTNYSGECCFLAMYDTAGNFIWAKQPICPNINYSSSSSGKSITVDSKGNAILAGNYTADCIFGTDTLFTYSNSAFWAKYSPTGNLIWVNSSLTNPTGGSTANGNIEDRADNFYITGTISGSVGFGIYTLTSPSASSTFVIKCDSDGNVLWAKQSSANWEGTSISADEINSIYIGGWSVFTPSSLTFDSYTLPLPLSYAKNNAFIMKFDTSGNPLCGNIVSNAGLTNSALPGGLTSDSSGNYVYLVSTFFNDTIICATDTFISKNGSNVFLGRWQSCNNVETFSEPILNKNSIEIFPNPSTGIFTISFAGEENLVPATIEVYNVLGQPVYNGMLKEVQHDEQIDLSNQPNGIYLYRVIAQDGGLVGEGKVVIQK